MDAPAFLWLIALPLAASPLIYLAGRIGAPLAGRQVASTGPGVVSRQERSAGRIAWQLSLLILLLAWVPYVTAVRAGGTAYPVEQVALHWDGLSMLLAGLALGLGTLVVLFSGPYLSSEVHQEKYYAILLTMVGAMIGLACAGDLFNLWLWFETMAVASYLLVAFHHEERAPLEAGVKYLVQSAAGSVLALLGVALVLTATGTLSLAALREAAQPGPALLAAGALFLTGFGVKVAMVPLHTWLPDAYSEAPVSVSAMLSGVVFGAGLVALLRVMAALAGVTLSWGLLLVAFGALNMLVGNLLALRQSEVKRLLAFSSVSHIGYMLLGAGISLHSGTPEGAAGGLFHLLTHGMMKALAFLAAGALLYALYSARGEHAPLKIGDLAGAAHRYPVVALSLSIALFGLAGLPPLAGFMSKWHIFVAGFATQSVLFQAAVIFAALNSVLSLAYYAPLVNTLYRNEPSARMRDGALIPRAMQLPLLLLALAIVAAGVWPGLLRWLAESAAVALMG